MICFNIKWCIYFSFVYQITTNLSGLKQHPFLSHSFSVFVSQQSVYGLPRSLYLKCRMVVVKMSAGAVVPCKQGLVGGSCLPSFYTIGRIKFFTDVRLTVAFIFSASKRKITLNLFLLKVTYLIKFGSPR